MIRFVLTTEKESRRVEERYDDLRKHRENRPKYKDVTIQNLEKTGYPAFVRAQKAQEKRDAAKKKRAAAKKETLAAAKQKKKVKC